MPAAARLNLYDLTREQLRVQRFSAAPRETDQDRNGNSRRCDMGEEHAQRERMAGASQRLGLED
jgi:hypothetical protein